MSAKNHCVIAGQNGDLLSGGRTEGLSGLRLPGYATVGARLVVLSAVLPAPVRPGVIHPVPVHPVPTCTAPACTVPAVAAPFRPPARAWHHARLDQVEPVEEASELVRLPQQIR